MKKIILFFAVLLIGLSEGNAQCIATYDFTTKVADNSGALQVIAGCNYSGDFNTVTGLVMGGNYTFASVTPLLVEKYITITDLTNQAIAHGMSPLTISSITSTDIRMHISDDSSCTLSTGCTNTTLLFLPNCASPTDASVVSTTTSADFNWTPAADETTWEVLVVANGGTAPTPETNGIEVTDLPVYTDLTLIAAHNYQFYVRTKCSPDESSVWVGPLNFSTKCNPIGLFAENFDTTAYNTLPICWSQVKMGSGSSSDSFVKVTDYNYYSAPYLVQLYNLDNAVDANLILVSPELENLSEGTHRLKFFAKNSYGNGALQIGTIDSNEEGYFTSLYDLDITTSYAEYTIDFASYEGTDKYIAIRHNGAYNTSIYLDDIRWELTPSCADVSEITVPTITASSATVNWNGGDAVTEWDLVYGPTSVNDPATLAPISPNPTGNPEVTLQDLLANTSYKIWIRSVCGTDVGVWIGPVTFTTGCLPSLVINENFDSTPTNTLPECWSQVKSQSGNSYATVSSYNYHSPSRTVLLYKSGTDITLVTPLLGNLSDGTHRLKFFASSPGTTAVVEVGTIDNSAEDSNFTLLQAHTLSAEYAEYVVDYTSYEGSDTHIAFRHAGEQNTTIYLDDIRWEITPLCDDITGITVPQVTTSTAVVNWDLGSGITQWDVVYGGVTVTDPSTLTPITPPIVAEAMLTGLTDNTTYKVWVRSVCGTNNGAWIGPISFETACLPMTSFNENFNSTPVESLPGCWSEVKNGESSFVSATDSDYYSEPRAIKLYSNGSNSASSNLMLVSPQLENLAAGTHKLKFYARSSGMPGSVQVGTLDNLSPDGTFSLLQSFPITYEYSEFSIDFADYDGEDTYIAFRHNSQIYNSIYLDDITWEQDLSIGTFDGPGIQYYPNPVKEVLTINNAQTITSVGIFNMLGQKVQEVAVNANDAKIDMGGLSAGSYIARVVADGQIKTIKVIKE